MASKDIEINIKATGIGALKSELKDLKSQLAEATDSKEMERLARAAGEVSDQIKDVNERVAVFAAGSEFEKVSNGLGLVGSQLASLDFKGAAESAKLFTTSIKSIDPKAFAGELKGLISTIGSLSKAFIQMGIKLLANPLFLLIAVIGAIVGVIIMLKDKIKIIEVAFDMLMIPINALIEGLKMFGDWLGLTSFAADEAAEKHIKANNKLVDSYNEREEVLSTQFEREIKLSKINGENTTQLEIEKQKNLNYYANLRVEKNKESLEELTEQMKRSTREQKKELMEQYTDLEKKIKDDTSIRSNSSFEIRAIKAQSIADEKEADKKSQEESVAKYKEYLKKKEDAQKLHVETLRKIKDIELSLLDEGIIKDKSIAEETYKRNIEDLNKTKVIYEDKIKLQNAYLAQKNAALIKADADEKIRTDAKKAEQDAKDLEDIAKFDARFALFQEATLSNYELELVQLTSSYDAKFELAKGNAELTLALKDKLNKDTTELNQKHRDAEDLAEKELNDKKFDAVKNSFETIGNLAVLFAGKSRKQQEQAFKVQQAANIAGATMDTYKAATGAYASLAGIPTVGPILGALAAAAAVTAGLINVKNISSQKFGGGGTQAAPATPSTPSIGGYSAGGSSSSAPLTPSFNLFGKKNDLNTAGSTESAQGSTQQNIVVTAVVSETEMTNTQNAVSNYQKSSFL